ncbi:MAG TPA: response regulator transcription factor [Solirubrobacteraceae bacterium]|nr:response regulator transcription factor [Solirubrobacteraceae bacterium]
MFKPRESLRVVIADDHPHYRAGLARGLRADGMAVLAEAPNAAAAIVAVVERMPDVVIMDLSMPGVPAVEAIRVLREHAPSAQVVVLTVSAECPDMADAILSGATGYVLKDDLPEHIVGAVRAAAAGESTISPRVASALLVRARGRGGSAGLLQHELGVLELLADGRSCQEIVETVLTSPRNVREHLVSILLKLAIDDRRQMSPRALGGRYA